MEDYTCTVHSISNIKTERYSSTKNLHDGDSDVLTNNLDISYKLNRFFFLLQ